RGGTGVHALDEMLPVEDAAEGDHWDAYCGADRAQAVEVIALPRAVVVDGIEEDLARAERLRTARPGHRIVRDRAARAIDDHRVDAGVIALHVHRGDDALRAVAARQARNQLGMVG